MLPIEIIIDILSFSCKNVKIFNDYSLLSKAIYNKLRERKRNNKRTKIFSYC